MKTTRVNREGFWKEGEDSALPMPRARARSWRGQGAFLTCLETAEIDAHAVHYRGWSTCRICGAHNGSSEFRLGNWVWPSGFRHYVEVHNVRPSLAFQEFIIQIKVT